MATIIRTLKDLAPIVVMAVTFLVATALLLILAATAEAGGCRQFFVQKQVAYVAPVYAAPIYYQAGLSIEQDALAEKVACLVTQKLAANQTLQQQAPRASAVTQHCAKCHSGATPKGDFVFDGSSPLFSQHITAALRAIASDKMPKDKKLTPEQKGALMQELLDLEAQEQPADRPPPQPQPPANGGELK